MAIARRLQALHDLGTVALYEVVFENFKSHELLSSRTLLSLPFTSFFTSWTIFIFDFNLSVSSFCYMSI